MIRIRAIPGLSRKPWAVFRFKREPREKQLGSTLEAQALSRLNAAGARLWRAKSLSQGLQEMLLATIELLAADMGNAQLLDVEHGVLRIVAQQGFKQAFLDFFREVSAQDDSACGRALRCRQVVIVEDVVAEPSFAPFLDVAREAGFRAVVSMPLVGYDGQPLGMLSAHFHRPHRPSALALEQLALYGQLAASFIQRWQSDEVTLRDNEERLRKALETQRVLVAELQHRARNMLAIVQSIALQILETSNTREEFENGFIDRLLSLSRVLGLLSRESMTPVTVSTLISMELEAFCSATDYRKITVNGPHVVLQSRIAQTLALGIHELTTNALKHGALAPMCGTGTLSIAWSVEGEGAERRLWLEWLEKHVEPRPHAHAAKKHGYGRTLLEEELPYSLSAQTKLDFAGDSLRCSISIPLGEGHHDHERIAA